jgi:BirA family transcriptional regulator, biotin operon repressor / biotin---[acetyl-CoA-carboxylase] ligase
MAESNFWRVQVLGTTPSTQDMVRAMAETGEPEGIAVQALQQSAGRGRHGHNWTSPMGNLYVSLLLRPHCTAGTAGQLAFVAGLALSAAMDEVIEDGHAKTLKWPNDVLIDGKKVSGILLETSLSSSGRVDYVIIGTGVNIFAVPEGAIGLDSIKSKPIFVNKFRDLYLDHLLGLYRGWQDKGFAFVREAWLKQAHGLGEDMKIRLPEITYRGTFRGIDENGALQAEIDGVPQVFTAGDVHFGVKD